MVNDITRRVAAVLDRLNSHRQAALLAQVAHNLTVSARDEGDDDSRLERLQRYNELQHVLTAQVCGLLKARESRYPIGVLLDAMMEKVGTDATGRALSDRMAWAFDLALDQEAEAKSTA